MGNYPAVPERTPVPPEITRLCVASWPITPHGGRAATLARAIQRAQPNKYQTWFYFTFGSNFRGENGDGQGGIVKVIKDLMPAGPDKERLAKHKSSPFCWIETSDAVRGIGGRDNLCEWVQTVPELMAVEEIKLLATTDPGLGDVIIDTTPGTSQPGLERNC